MGVDALVQKVLSESGVNPKRYNLKWASAAEAPRFVKLITDFTQEIKDLGPLGETEGLDPEEIKIRINNALNVVSSQKLRVSFGNATKAIRKDADYSEEHITEVIESKLKNPITNGLIEQGLLSTLTSASPASIDELADKVGTSTEQAEKILTMLGKKGHVSQDGSNWSIGN
jgi:hypothetical protein